MKIFFRKKELNDIKTFGDLEKFIIDNNIYKYFKKFPNSKINDIQDKIDNTEKLSFKSIKKWVKSVLNYPETIYDERFLLSMGWDEFDVKSFISETQKKNSLILSNKKQKSPELFYVKNPNRVEYWKSKGFSEEESKLKIKERQSTFSKEICIQKYGLDKGIEVFNDRQRKWIDSLLKNPDYENIQKKKNTYRYNEDKYDKLVKMSSFLNSTKEIILKYINSQNIECFVSNVIEDIDIKRYSDIHPYISSSIIHKKFNTTKEEIKDIFYKKTNCSFTKQTYGTPIYHNGIRFKSTKEYEIALFLENKGISYIYEKNYPNSNSKFDFYIPILNVYIEYYGMLDGKNLDKLNHIQVNYFNNMNKKNLFCELNNLNLVCDTNYNNLIKKLKIYL